MLEKNLNNWDAASLQEIDSCHHFHPFTDPLALAKDGLRIVTHAEDIYVFDAQGRKFLDGMSGLWCCILGMKQPALAQAAYEQLNTLPYYNSFFQSTTPSTALLSKSLTDLLAHRSEGYNHVFFSSGGSEANDTNVKMVLRYWQLLNQPQRKIFIARNLAYHGSTVAASCLGGFDVMHNQMGIKPLDVAHIMHPDYWALANEGENEHDFGLRAAQDLERKILEVGADNVAAFIAEPVQGAGGVFIPPESYWPEIQRIVDKYGILFISDEVICAFGRLGTAFGFEKFGTSPDLVTFAKGVTNGAIPLGGSIISDKIGKVLLEKGGELFHGYTYSGHPVACAVGLKTLEILREEHLIEQIANIKSPYLTQKFELLKSHPLVGDAKIMGFIGVIQLAKDKEKRQAFDSTLGVGMICRKHCKNHGLIMRAVGDRMIIAPPFTMTLAQIDEMVEKIRFCLDDTLAEISK